MTGLAFAPDLDEDGIKEVEQLVGQPIRVERYNREAGLDVIRHYSHGIGDDNPLYCDPEYAASSPFGTVVAPPTFLYSVFDGAIGAGLPGIQPIFAGTEWTFYRHVRRGAELVADSVFGPVRRLTGSTASEMLIQTADTTYLADGEVVARALASTFRVPRRGARGGLEYETRDEYRYTAEEHAEIRAAALGEFRRGAERLDLSTVQVGDEIGTVVKGPIDRITMTSYYAGCIGSPGYKACEIAWKYRDYAENDTTKLPTNYDPSYFAETVLPSLGHQDADVANEIGMPNAYDNGPQRCGWFAHAVTNWAGDHALLHQLAVRLRRPDIFGDTLWIKGVVDAVSVQQGYGVVDLVLEGVNQLGVTTATATATVLVSLDDPAPPVEVDRSFALRPRS
jgi:acyl dehydratase